MKCLQHKQTNEVIRVTDEKAKGLVASDSWRYAPKWAWKAYRDAQNAINGAS